MKLAKMYQPIAISSLLFVVVLVSVLLVAMKLPYQGWREAMHLLAVLPAIWVGVEATRLMRALDELQQRIALETLAFSLANTALVILALGLMQLISPSYFNVLWLLPIFAGFTVLGGWLTRRRYE